MSNKLLNVLGIIAHYKYLITVIIGVVLVGFVDENSFLQRVKYDLHISQLKAEIKKYEQQNDRATAEPRALRKDPRTIERIARERYFMQADDEDIFVLSTDKPENSQDKNVEDIASDETSLSKIQSILFIIGGVLMVIGVGCFVFMVQQLVMCWVFLAGAVLFATMQPAPGL